MKITKQHIYIGIAVLFVIGLIAWHFYRKGKIKAGAYQAQYPTGGTNIPASWNPYPLAQELHDVLDSTFTLSGTKDIVFIKALELATDDMLVAVYNVFNQNYNTDNAGTLTKWLQDEWNYDWVSNKKNELIEKLQKLSCF